jgi:ferredoxin
MARRCLSSGELLAVRNPKASLYCCDLTGFMQQVRELAQGAGWPEQALHQEHFKAPDEPDSETAFELVLAASRTQVHVRAGESIIDAAARVGVEIPLSCGMGMCGCCLTRVLEGVPAHRDSYLDVDEQASGAWILPCVSACASGRLVLDR